MKLYSNEENKRLISLLTSKGREPHSLVITGEPGSGRKTLARYFAASLMCDSKSGTPCGSCKSCRMLANNEHPDFITAVPNDNGSYTLDSIRQLVSDSVIKPNEGDLKVYLIPDLDRSGQTAAAVQNVLLKLVEEPPDHCIIIMTAAAKEIFLPTIISRVITLATEPCSRSDAEEWLTLQGRFQQEDIIRAAACCGGSFGRCIEFLEGSTLAPAFECAKDVVTAVLARDEYMILKAFFACEGKKQVLKEALGFLAQIMRGACLMRIGAKPEDCCWDRGAEMLSEKLSGTALERLYELMTDASQRLTLNCNQNLTVNTLTAQIYSALR